VDAKGAAMVLDAITQVELFVNVFVGVYVLAILAYILTSWVQLPYSLRPVQRFLYDVCDPYLRVWRRLLPFSAGPIDFSPMIAVVALIVLEQIVIAILGRLH
jgi:YggT family protein